jgi:glutathione peroxidase
MHPNRFERRNVTGGSRAALYDSAKLCSKRGGDNLDVRSFLRPLIVVSIFAPVTGCAAPVKGVTQEETVLRLVMKSLEGQEIDLAQYEGKVLMIVNVASNCGYTGQYEQLQRLQKKYAIQGLAVLGFPCNQFLGQEPGTAQEIQEFCRANYGVTFDMFDKVEVNGEGACELYQYLTSLDTKPKGAGKIGWNFEKFLIDRRGFVVARFGSGTKPDAPEVVELIERELAKKPASNTEK